MEEKEIEGGKDECFKERQRKEERMKERELSEMQRKKREG